MSGLPPEAQLDECLAEFDDRVAALAVACLARMRKLLPGAHELVYDAYSALSIGFASGERLKDGILHVAIYPRYVNVGFFHGTALDDPKGILEGTGSKIRHVTIREAKDLDSPELTRLVRSAARHAGFKKGDGELIIKKIYPKKRPRRP